VTSAGLIGLCGYQIRYFMTELQSWHGSEGACKENICITSAYIARAQKIWVR